MTIIIKFVGSDLNNYLFSINFILYFKFKNCIIYNMAAAFIKIYNLDKIRLAAADLLIYYITGGKMYVDTNTAY